jgi:hypothetical protein
MRVGSWQYFWSTSLLALALSAAAHARTADPTEWGDESAADDDHQPKPAAPPSEAAPEQPALEQPPPEAAVPIDATPAAAEGASAAGSDYLLGLRYRGVFLPAGVLHWFIEGGESIYVNGVGPELAIEDGNFEYVLSAWMALYTMDPVAIKGTNDAEEAWEIVDSSMKSLYLTFDYLWHHPSRAASISATAAAPGSASCSAICTARRPRCAAAVRAATRTTTSSVTGSTSRCRAAIATTSTITTTAMASRTGSTVAPSRRCCPGSAGKSGCAISRIPSSWRGSISASARAGFYFGVGADYGL